MNSIEQFKMMKQSAHGSIHNLDALGLSGTEQRPIKILWMYPGTLSLHGGRGDLMALLRFATLAKRPVDIRRIENLNDPIPLDEADMLYFCAGDLSCMASVISALEPELQNLRAFAEKGGVILANGSTGAILAKSLTLTDGTQIPGLGLLDMHWTQRTTVHGDDLWFQTENGLQVIGNQIALADVTLGQEQKAFGQVIYGRGNNNSGLEGAIWNNVIYTGCLGPVLVRNPLLAMDLLKRAAQAAKLPCEDELFSLPPEELKLEDSAIRESKAFIEKKMKQ